MKKIVEKMMEKKEEIYNILIILICVLFPVSVYFWGKLLTNIFFPLLVILAIVKIFKTGLKTSFYDKYFIGFIIIIILSMLFENYPREKTIVWQLKQLLRWSALPFLIGQFELEEKHYKSVLIGYGISFILILNKSFKAISGWLEAVQGKDLSYLDILKVENIKFLFKQNYFRMHDFGENYLFPTITENGIMLGIIVMFSACIIFRSGKEKWIKIISLPFLILGIYFFLITQARGMYVAMIVTILGYFAIKIYENRKVENYKKYMKRMGVVVGAFLLLILLTPKENVVKERFLSIGKGDQARVVVYTEVLKIAKDNPLTGIGYGNFSQAEKSIKNDFSYWGKYKHQHNMGLKMLSETGIFGFLIYFAMMGAVLFNLLKPKRELICSLAAGVTSIYLIYENFETIVIYHKPNIYIFFLIAIALNKYYKHSGGPHCQIKKSN